LFLPFHSNKYPILQIANSGGTVRILLVQSQSVIKTGAVFPLGLVYLATGLTNHHHDVKICDTNNDSRSPYNLRKIVREFEPDIIGVGLRNIDNSDYGHFHSFVSPFRDLIDYLKKISPSAKMVGGGSGFSLYAQTLMEKIPGLDYGVFGEGEETLPDLIDHPENITSVKGIYYRENGSIVFTGRREPIDFGSFPSPNRNLIDLGPYLTKEFTIGVQTRRGCPFQCAYCTYSYLQGSSMRIRPVADVIDELETLTKQYGLKSLAC
jgi:radical SAM superfamily enzyme YgiQ (UPF0313 family)